MASPCATSPKRLIPATQNVNRISIKREEVFKIFPRDMYKVFNRVLKPSETFTILSNLETLIIRRAVTLKPIFSKSDSSKATRDAKTMTKSNLFQLTYQ